MLNVLHIRSHNFLPNNMYLDKIHKSIEGRVKACALLMLAGSSAFILCNSPLILVGGSLFILYNSSCAVSVIKDFYHRNVSPPLEECRNKVKSTFASVLQVEQSPLKIVQSIVHKCALTIFAGMGEWCCSAVILAIFHIFLDVSYVPPTLHPAFSYLADLCYNLLDLVDTTSLRILGIPDTNSFGPLCLTGPIIEEVFFRLMVQELLLKRGLQCAFKKLGISLPPNTIYLKFSIIVLSSTLFAASHRWAFSTNHFMNSMGAAALPCLLFSGLAFGAAQEITGNLMYPIGMHMTTNTITTLAHFFFK